MSKKVNETHKSERNQRKSTYIYTDQRKHVDTRKEKTTTTQTHKIKGNRWKSTAKQQTHS